MKSKEISEGPISALKKVGRATQRGIAKGFTATQKGGAIGPDALERGIKNFFTSTGKEEPKDSKQDKKDAEIAKLKKDLDAQKKQNKQKPVQAKSKDKKMGKAVKEGLADLAGRAEADHEVQMARADLYKIAKYAIKLHDMLKGVSEETGLEGWQQAKITKAADYIGSVYHNLDYDMKFGEGMNEGVEMCPDECCGKPVTECSCGPDCPHCDCYEKNKAMKEGKYKNDAQRKAVHAAKAEKKDKYKESIARKLEQKLSGK
jgi:hypothetical protein